MHGTINRAIECFVRENHGNATWQAVCERAGLGFSEFEPLLTYPDDMTDRVLAAVEAQTGKPREAFLEDLGTFLVCHPRFEAVRRLLRYGGANFSDFLESLDELHDRARLALEELDVPKLRMRRTAADEARVQVRWRPGLSAIVLGVLRAMADDYGALVIVERDGPERAGRAAFRLRLLDAAFAHGRDFALGGRAA